MRVKVGKLGSGSAAPPQRHQRVTYADESGGDGSGVLEQLSHGGVRVSDAAWHPAPGSKIALRIPVGGARALLAPAEGIGRAGSGFTARWLPGNSIFERFLDKSLGPSGR